MDIKELENIALDSQKDGFHIDSSYISPDLDTYAFFNQSSFRDRILSLQQQYGNLLIADLGGSGNLAISELNQFSSVEAFCIDLNPIFNPNFGYRQRMIIADLNKILEIQDETFDYMFSFNALSYTIPSKSFPEIYRILKKGGTADIDLKFWAVSFYKEMLGLSFKDELFLNVQGKEIPFNQTSELITSENALRLNILSKFVLKKRL
tara:strand:- start:70 stop:690 length:621 start_codon:yes stop_codon:yes gene_type:complete